MSDVREGITPTQHAVLDMLDRRAASWGDHLDFEGQLRMAHARARSARLAAKLTAKRNFAIEAAARLIDAADEIGRMLAAGDQ